ncbi:hypothetical protein LP416_30985 [Polaromonas sp. P2-4]|nr:hypothetical protein LP416_30985 [Polaromonas sp. P2-4]
MESASSVRQSIRATGKLPEEVSVLKFDPNYDPRGTCYAFYFSAYSISGAIVMKASLLTVFLALTFCVPNAVLAGDEGRHSGHKGWWAGEWKEEFWDGPCEVKIESKRRGVQAGDKVQRRSRRTVGRHMEERIYGRPLQGQAGCQA